MIRSFVRWAVTAGCVCDLCVSVKPDGFTELVSMLLLAAGIIIDTESWCGSSGKGELLLLLLLIAGRRQRQPSLMLAAAQPVDSSPHKLA